MADLNTMAFRIVKESTEPKPELTPAQESGRRGGKKGGANGGRSRAEKLTPEQRSEIARNAAQARWNPP